MERSEIVAFISSCVTDILKREQLPAPPDIYENTVIFGEQGVLSSLMLVELMLALEDFCAQKGLAFTWASDSAMSARRSVYRRVNSLADFILSLPATDKQGGKVG